MVDKKSDEEQAVERRLELLLQDFQTAQRRTTLTPHEILALMEKAISMAKRENGLVARLEFVVWRLSSPLWDLRIRRQIRVVRELGQTAGWDAQETHDAIHHLDDLVFARTYGRVAEQPIKRVVRELAKRDEFARFELRNLILNRCLRVTAQGRVEAPSNRWLLTGGIFMLALIIIGVTIPLLVAYLGSLSFTASLIVNVILASVFGIGYWMIDMYAFLPHRLIPRAQYALRRPQVVSP